VNKIEFADALYARAFPAVIILCAVVGTLSFALGAYPQCLASFFAVAIGMKGNDVVERRRFERAERLAGLGWSRTRSPSSIS
jgi:hypothetical protein